MIFSSQQPPESFNSQQNNQTSKNSVNWSEINLEQIFRLIDSILPLQVCLNYQILPISLIDKCLTIGVVKKEDISLLEHIKHLLPSSNYSLKPQLITSQTYQLIVSAYLKFNRTKEQANQPSNAKDLTNKPQQGSPEGDSPKNPNERPTLIVDSPTQIYNKEETTKLDFDLGTLNKAPIVESSFQDTEFSGEKDLIDFDLEKSLDFHQPVELEAKAKYLSMPLGSLTFLSAKELWQELLARVLSGGIGRLYFERQIDRGRIIWSQNGVLQSSLEKLSFSVFQSVLNELKHLAQLPAIPLTKSKKIEMQKYYQQERLLLRLRFVPGQHGEEGTLQVLRGEALKFYQQRQMDELGDQAIQLAQELEKKLKQIEVRTRINPAQLDFLPALTKIQEKINQQLKFFDS